MDLISDDHVALHVHEFALMSLSLDNVDIQEQKTIGAVTIMFATGLGADDNPAAATKLPTESVPESAVRLGDDSDQPYGTVDGEVAVLSEENLAVLARILNSSQLGQNNLAESRKNTLEWLQHKRFLGRFEADLPELVKSRLGDEGNEDDDVA